MPNQPNQIDPGGGAKLIVPSKTNGRAATIDLPDDFDNTGVDNFEALVDSLVQPTESVEMRRQRRAQERLAAEQSEDQLRSYRAQKREERRASELRDAMVDRYDFNPKSLEGKDSKELTRMLKTRRQEMLKRRGPVEREESFTQLALRHVNNALTKKGAKPVDEKIWNAMKPEQRRELLQKTRTSAPTPRKTPHDFERAAQARRLGVSLDELTELERLAG